MANGRKHLINEKGFSIVELMIALAVLGVGLLALAQMQVASIYGNSASRSYNTAVNLVEARIETAKVKGLFQFDGSTNINYDSGTEFRYFLDNNPGNAANLSDTANYDYFELINEGVADPVCETTWTEKGCGDFTADYTRYVNVRNIPAGSNDADTVMKEIAVIVTWEEGGSIRKVGMRTLVGRRDFDFF